MKQLGSTDQKRLNREWRRRTDQRVALLLDGLQQPFNVGSIIRTAAVLRVEQIWAAGPTPSPRSTKVAKIALGTDRYLAWTPVESTAAGADAARAAGFEVVGLELAAGARPAHEVDLSGPVCLAIGHEDRGLSPAALGACDRAVFIPQLGRVGSLNVAQATAIALYEVRRQGWARMPADDDAGRADRAEPAGRADRIGARPDAASGKGTG